MVKQGFLNLEDEEQERILEAAIQEFSEKNYDSASINRIIRQAGISKGSMYHYFKNKEDLYLYMIDKVMEKKAAYLTSAFKSTDQDPSSLDFFHLLALQLKSSLIFAKENYPYHKINTRLQSMQECHLKEKVWGRFHGAFKQYMDSLVQRAIEDGDIRTDLQKDFIIRLLGLVLMRLTDLYPNHEELLSKSEDELLHHMDELVLFLKSGLQKKEEIP